MSSALAQSLQIALQETAILGVLAALTVGALGVGTRRLFGVARERRAESAAGESSTDAVDGPTRRPIADGSGRRRRKDETPEEFERRLNNLEAEVGELSSSVQEVQQENAEIAESVEDVNGHLKRLLNFSGTLARGVNPFADRDEPDELADAFQRNARTNDAGGNDPEDAFQRNAREQQSGEATTGNAKPGAKRHRPVQHDKVETIPGGTGDAEEFDRMEEEVEELDTLSFADEDAKGFSPDEPTAAELGTEEVIAEQEPANTASTEQAIGDGGTVIETQEEELDITPGAVSEPAPAPQPEPEEPEDSDPLEVESGFQFGAKALEDDEPESTTDEATAADTEVTEDSPALASEAELFDDAEVEPVEEDTPDWDVDAELATEEETTLDSETEAELAAAEAAFAEKLDESDSHSALAEELGSSALSEELFEEAESAEQTESTEPDAGSKQTEEVEAATTNALEQTIDPTPEPTETDAEAAVESPTELVEKLDTSPDPEPASEPAASEAVETPDGEPSTDVAATLDAGLDQTAIGGDGGKPYVGTLPDGYAAELLVVEWLEYLVDTVGVHGTARAIDYYESIDWITEAVAADLEEYLHGFEPESADRLRPEEHMRSLAYVDELARSGSLRTPVDAEDEK